MNRKTTLLFSPTSAAAGFGASALQLADHDCADLLHMPLSFFGARAYAPEVDTYRFYRPG